MNALITGGDQTGENIRRDPERYHGDKHGRTLRPLDTKGSNALPALNKPLFDQFIDCLANSIAGYTELGHQLRF
ncbi:hypothetical protein SPIRO4BDMA_40928 [uncultured spirochete]|uniref:Uncharacterized protein n=1 Tax=uncultured spirochete TaxID=156406 RepID=A0A3P3XPY3_9SPIR|nr:hypothetical protein SPIRO4BDMA_40928 [uncultured spirochete]